MDGAGDKRLPASHAGPHKRARKCKDPQMAKLKELPEIPTLPKEMDEKYSGLRQQEYPPILLDHSWTKSVLYKHEFTDLTPGERVGNHFTRVKCRMRDLIHPPKPKAMKIQIDIQAYKAPPPTLEKKFTEGICSHSIMPIEVPSFKSFCILRILCLRWGRVLQFLFVI